MSGGGELLGVSFFPELSVFFFRPAELLSAKLNFSGHLHGVSLRSWEHVRDGAESKVIGASLKNTGSSNGLKGIER